VAEFDPVSSSGATLRAVSAFPELNPGKLTFATVMALFIEMLSIGSRGAHELFIVASLLHAKTEQKGTGERVEAKSLIASHLNSRISPDIQIKRGNDVVEAFEVTANQWSEKLGGAADKIRAYDLSRLHIIARIDEPYRQMLEELLAQRDDISALERQAFISVHVAEMKRQFRALALSRLYDFLDRYQPDNNRVNAYVELLGRHGLSTPARDSGASVPSVGEPAGPAEGKPREERNEGRQDATS
jgi:hypothetical protein